MAVLNSSNHDDQSGDEDDSISMELGDDDYDHDLFADSATTSSDLFGHGSKSHSKFRQEAPNFLSMDKEEEEEEEEEWEIDVDAEDPFNAFAVNRNTHKSAPSRIEINDDGNFAQFTKDRNPHLPSRQRSPTAVRKSSPSEVFNDDDAFAQFAAKDRSTHQPCRSKQDEMPPVVPNLEIETLEVGKAYAIANEDHLRAAELQEQIDRLTESSSPRKSPQKTSQKTSREVFLGLQFVSPKSAARRSNAPTRSGHARSGTPSRRPNTTPSKRSPHSRRPAHTIRRGRRPSNDSKDEEGTPTEPVRRRLSGDHHLPPPEAPAGTPGTPSERSGRKTRTSSSSSSHRRRPGHHRRLSSDGHHLPPPEAPAGTPESPSKRSGRKTGSSSIGSSHHRRSGHRRQSGGHHLPPPEAPAVTPESPSKRPGRKTKSSFLSPTGVMDDESPVSTSSGGHGQRSSRHLRSPAIDATPRSSRSREQTSCRTKKQEQPGSAMERVKRQQQSSILLLDDRGVSEDILEF